VRGIDWIEHRRLFSGCGNQLMAVVGADSGKIISTLPIGDGVDATAFDPETGLAFASCGEGGLTVVHEDSADKFSVAESVPTKRGARSARSREAPDFPGNRGVRTASRPNRRSAPPQARDFA
jgi:hypothetical protein